MPSCTQSRKIPSQSSAWTCQSRASEESKRCKNAIAPERALWLRLGAWKSIPRRRAALRCQLCRTRRQSVRASLASFGSWARCQRTRREKAMRLRSWRAVAIRRFVRGGGDGRKRVRRGLIPEFARRRSVSTVDAGLGDYVRRRRPRRTPFYVVCHSARAWHGHGWMGGGAVACPWFGQGPAGMSGFRPRTRTRATRERGAPHVSRDRLRPARWSARGSAGPRGAGGRRSRRDGDTLDGRYRDLLWARRKDVLWLGTLLGEEVGEPRPHDAEMIRVVYLARWPKVLSTWVPASIEHAITMCGAVDLRTVYLRPEIAPAPRTCCVVTPLLREFVLHVVACGMLRARSTPTPTGRATRRSRASWRPRRSRSPI